MTDEPEGHRARLAAAMRRLTTLVVARAIDEDALGDAADVVDELAATLDARAGTAPRLRPVPRPDAVAQDVFPTSPVIGAFSPLSPPVEIWKADGELQGRARFGRPYEGPPGWVHGGVIAEVFDEVLGVALLVVGGTGGVTGTLTVRFSKPTPLGAEVRLVARPTTAEGRKLGVWGAMYVDGELTAEAEAVFIAVAFDSLASVKAATGTGPDAASED